MYALIGILSTGIFIAFLYISKTIYMDQWDLTKSLLDSSIVACNFCIVASVLFALKEYGSNEKQKALSNAFLAVDRFYDSLQPRDINEFKKIIIANGESAGGDNNGRFMGDDNKLYDFGCYFTEGAVELDGLALDRITSSLERTCFLALNNSINRDVIFLELGQFIHISYVILKAIPHFEDNLLSNFPSIKKFYLQYKDNAMPYKIIGYIE